MDPPLFQLSETGSGEDEVSVIIKLADVSRPPQGVTIVARFGNVVTARLKRNSIIETWRSDQVLSMKASRAVVAPLPFDDDLPEEQHESEALLDAAPRRARPKLDVNGKGVIVGVCDWGLDITHPNFRNEDGSTRLIALWDQRAKTSSPLQPYGYGKLHTRDDINRALQEPDPFAALGYEFHSNDRGDRGSHGTHVTDILAGNGRVRGGTPSTGLASGAELVFVQLTMQRMDDLADFGDSVCLLEALDFVRQIANRERKPCVINLSAGKTGGEHRGTNPFEQAVDAMLTGQDNLALVQSAGNYASTAMHTHARLGPDQSYTLEWIVNDRDRTQNELEVWYSGQDVFDVTLIAPTGERFTAPLGGRTHLVVNGQRWGDLHHRRLEPNSGLNHINIFLRPTSPPGRWRVALRGSEIVDGRFHAWIERDAGGVHQSRFARHQATSSYTTNTICNSLRAIAVGAYDATQPDRPPTRFSSRGPTADGRQKPEIAAPGYRIRAARSMPQGGWKSGEAMLTTKSGTSMAAPHAAAVVACMYEAAARPMSISEVRRVLIGTADPHPGPAGRSSTQLGYGYLNPEAAVEAVRELTSRPRMPDGESPPPFRGAEHIGETDHDGEDDEPREDDVHATLDFGDQDFGDEDQGDEDYGDEDYGDEDFGDEDYGDPGEDDELWSRQEHDTELAAEDGATSEDDAWSASNDPWAIAAAEDYDEGDRNPPWHGEDDSPSSEPAPTPTTDDSDLTGFVTEVDELGLDSGAAFRSHRHRPRRGPVEQGSDW